MCGRFVEYTGIEGLEQHFPIDEVDCQVTPNYNVAPTQEIAAVIRVHDVNKLVVRHWGLVPHWAKDIKTAYKMINARAESVAKKPAFHEAFRKRRCLIPANGFYEWTGPAGDKQPYYISAVDNKPMAFAGLWEVWYDKENEQNIYQSCTIITRDASPCVRDLHNRMPAVLHPDVYATWLNTDYQDAAGLQKLLAEQTVTEFKTRPVSKQVNRVVVNEASNIA